MYAVVRTGGKQYRVAAGDVVEVEKLAGDIGEEIQLNDVLLVSNGEQISIGQPMVDGASVKAIITGQYRGPKILSFRYRPKKRIRVRRGHRQYLTRLEIQSVILNGESFTSAPLLGPEPLQKPAKQKKQTSAADSAESEKLSSAAEDSSATLASTAASVTGAASEDVESTTSAVEESVTSVVEHAESSVEAISEAAGEVKSTVEDTATDIAEAAESAGDTVTDAAESVASVAAESVDRISDVIDEVVETVEDVIDDATEDSEADSSADSPETDKSD